MKTVLGVAAGLFLVFTVGGCLSGRYVANSSDALYGAWVNRDYVNTYFDWRFVFQRDGRLLIWQNGQAGDKPANMEGRFVVDETWVDSEGNVWYRTSERSCIAPYSEEKSSRMYGLVKIGDKGEVMEGEWSPIVSPPSFGALGNRHWVYHRE